MNDDADLLTMILRTMGSNFTNFMDETGSYDIDSFMDAFIDKCIEDNNETMLEFFKEKYPEKFI